MIIICTGVVGSGKTTYAQNYIKDILGTNKNAKINIINGFEQEYDMFKDNIVFCKSIEDISSNYDLIIFENSNLSETDLAKIETLSKNSTIICISQYISDAQRQKFIEMGANIHHCVR